MNRIRLAGKKIILKLIKRTEYERRDLKIEYIYFMHVLKMLKKT